MALSYKSLRAKFEAEAKGLLKIRECHNLIKMNTKKNDHLVGIARDLALLEWGCNHKYIDIFMAQEITKNPWKNNVYKQLAYFVNQRFMRKIKLKGIPLWRITKLGIEYFNSKTGENYSILIARAKCSPNLYAHTMIVQIAMYKYFLELPEKSLFLSEYRGAALTGWLEHVDARLPKIPDLIIYADNEIDIIGMAIEIEIEAKKPWMAQRALQGMERILFKTIADEAHYCFVKDGGYNVYKPYLESEKKAYDYDRIGNLIYTDGHKIERSLQTVKRNYIVNDVVPVKENKKNKSDPDIWLDVFEIRRYLHIEDKQAKNSTVKKKGFDMWMTEAKKVFDNRLDRDFHIIEDFIFEVLHGAQAHVLLIPKRKRKLLSQLLLLVDTDDYNESELFELSDHLHEPELE